MPESAHEFLRGVRLGTVVYLNDPWPGAVPVWYHWTGEAMEFFTQPTRPKVRRLTENPKVAMVVSASVCEPPYWVTIEGNAVLSNDGSALVEMMCDRYLDNTEYSLSLRDSLMAGRDQVVKVTIVPEQVRHFVS